MKNIVILEKFSPILSYKVKYAIYLSLVPFFMISILLVLLFSFAKLNLYYLEGSGLIIDSQVRTAYYDKIIAELVPFIGVLGIIVLVSFVIGYIIMNWAVSPFTTARRIIASKPKEKFSFSRISMSENLSFDKTVQLLVSSINVEGKLPKLDKKNVSINLNFNFLIKFFSIYTLISIINALSLSTLLNSIYDRIVSIALNVLHGREIPSHYFLAQEEILETTVVILLCGGLFVYLMIGYRVSQYMSTMIFVFSNAIFNRKFPLTLRKTDLYHELAHELNEQVSKVQKG